MSNQSGITHNSDRITGYTGRIATEPKASFETTEVFGHLAAVASGQ